MAGIDLHRPTDAMAAQAVKARLGSRGAFVGGGTALQLGWVEREPELTLVPVAALPQAQGVALVDAAPWGGRLRIGAAVRLEQVRTDVLVREHAPLLSTACEALAALSVRNLATLGGNVGWGSGDALAALMALDAQAELADGTLQPLPALLALDELPLLVALHVPLGPPTRRAWFEKIGHRQSFSPTRLTLAGCAAGGARVAMAQVRLACCAAGLRARRMVHVEALLDGRAAPQVASSAVHAACAQDLPASPALARLAGRVVDGQLRLGAWS